MKNRQKLELTWIGKDKRLNLEARILIEDPEKSYGDKNSENMLVFGDNLLALKALEQKVGDVHWEQKVGDVHWIIDLQ